MFGVEYTGMEECVEGVVELGVFELVVEHEDEEAVEGEDGGETVAVVGGAGVTTCSGCKSGATLERPGEVFRKPQWRRAHIEHVR